MEQELSGTGGGRLGWPLAAGVAAVLALHAATYWPRALPAQANAAVAATAGTASEHGSRAGQQAQRAELVAHLERNPRDGRGWALLALAEMRAERFDAAVAAFEKAVTVGRKVAADPTVWCEYADALGMAQGRSLAGRPTELVMHALSLRPNHPRALEMAGSAAYERRDFALAAQYWKQLLAQLQAGSQMHEELNQALQRAERLAATQLPGPR